MSSGAADPRAAADHWLLKLCSCEILAQRALLLFVVAPLVGIWLPALVQYFAFSILLQLAQPTSAASESWATVLISLTAAITVIAAGVGAKRQHDRQAVDDDAAEARGLKLSPKTTAHLEARVAAIWSSLGQEHRSTPRLICRPHFGIVAHAYDNKGRQSIEVSAGLTRGLQQDEPLSISILQHEMAHLVFRDLPSIRLQSAIVAASLASLRIAVAICIVAGCAIATVLDFGETRAAVSIAALGAMHVAIAAAVLVVATPLILAEYLIRRYGGFIVALIENRADVSAGVWGDGTQVLSQRLRASSDHQDRTTDVGLAYLSPKLNHLPLLHRAELLSSVERLATPKLGYFVATAVVVWLLPFHQGEQYWDSMLLRIVVALTQALTIYMVVASRGHVPLGVKGSVALASAIVFLQALPLISIEAWAYLAQHLTAAIVIPGGFGSAEHADYIQDLLDTTADFTKRALRVTGGGSAILAVGVVAFSLWLLSRLPKRRAHLPATASGLAAVVSLVVSYNFFAESIYRHIRNTAFRVGNGAVDDWRAALANRLLTVSEEFSGDGPLSSYPWLRIMLPILIALAVAGLASPIVLLTTKAHCVWRRGRQAGIANDS